MIKLLFFTLLLTLTTQAAMFQTVPKAKAKILQSGKDARYCAICGMDLVKFYKTSHSAKVNGKQKQFCSIHCLAQTINSKKKVTDIQVVDAVGLEFIDANKAFYVVHSNKKGTMSRVSKYAFKTKQEALAFQKRFGGKIMNFKEALQVAQKDFTANHTMMHHKSH